MEMTHIVPTHEVHMPSLVQLGKEQWPEEDWVTFPYLTLTWRKTGFHFTALHQNRPIGSIMAVEEDYPKYWIHYFVVDKAYRRQGTGSKLLQAVEEKMAKGTFLFVDLEQHDAVGLSFYDKNGFKVMGKVQNWFAGKEGLILAKEIK